MKKKRSILWLVVVLILVTIGVVIVFIIPKGESFINQDNVESEDSNKSIQSFNVTQLSMSEWNTSDGIPYAQVPGANLGVTSFEIVDNERVAYLSDASSEIIITEIDNGKAIKKFPVLVAPRDFIYEKGLFYVLGKSQIIVYDSNGNEKNQINIPDDYYSRAGRLARFENATYLLLVSGNCVKIESGSTTLLPQEYQGWITSSGNYFSTQVKGDNRYSVKVFQANHEISEKVYFTDNDKKAAGVFIIGTTENRILLDVQTFICENPIAIERFIVSVSIQNDEFGEIINSIKVPDSYYVLSNKEFCLSTTGEVINMVTAPKGVYIFSLTENKTYNEKGYPKSVTSEEYHFNNHLMETERK
jgi:hypothetical protein